LENDDETYSDVYAAMQVVNSKHSDVFKKAEAEKEREKYHENSKCDGLAF
jgi:hypothetical protein